MLIITAKKLYLPALLLENNFRMKKVVEMCVKEGMFSKIFGIFVWMNGFQKSLAHTDYNMFVDDC